MVRKHTIRSLRKTTDDFWNPGVACNLQACHGQLYQLLTHYKKIIKQFSKFNDGVVRLLMPLLLLLSTYSTVSSNWLYLKCQVFRISYFSRRNIITIIRGKCLKTSVYGHIINQPSFHRGINSKMVI
jgi:hypothetical protein